jgi:hypothetical protein
VTEPTKRTDAQRAADEQLTAAVEAVARAYDNLPAATVLTDYLVVGQGVRWDDDGEQITQIFTAFRDGAMGPVQILGLLDYALSRWRHVFATEDED